LFGEVRVGDVKTINHLPCPRHSPLVCPLYLQPLKEIALEGSAILILERLGGMKILHLGFANGAMPAGIAFYAIVIRIVL
jgi:hypothetical protein